ncbi:MAG: AbrB/MazE/SpoVT family DNA-binding domain-containing protein [archaeon]
MAVETIKMSSKGQVVIPKDIRDMIGANEDTIFAVTNSKDTVVLKKIEIPTKDELISQLKIIAEQGKTRLQKKGISESDLQKK